MNQPKEVLEARPYAVESAQKIAEIANSKFNGRGSFMAGLISSMAFQTIIVSIAIDKYAPGSSEGEDLINGAFESAKMDAIARWKDDDLKKRFDGQKRHQ